MTSSIIKQKRWTDRRLRQRMNESNESSSPAQATTDWCLLCDSFNDGNYLLPSSFHTLYDQLLGSLDVNNDGLVYDNLTAPTDETSFFASMSTSWRTLIELQRQVMRRSSTVSPSRCFAQKKHGNHLSNVSWSSSGIEYARLFSSNSVENSQTTTTPAEPLSLRAFHQPTSLQSQLEQTLSNLLWLIPKKGTGTQNMERLRRKLTYRTNRLIASLSLIILST
jgi:hypothetical protein